jgi:threonine synthase
MSAPQFRSTRPGSQSVDLVQAIKDGLAPDGGLYVPEVFPSLAPEDFHECQTITEVGIRLLQPFFNGSKLEQALPQICQHAFGFPITLVPTRDVNVRILELFHGPTAAFKDVGARFLAGCLEHSREPNDAPLTVLVATSGDTGGAVAGAFEDYPWTKVAILFPAGMVSERQEHQLCCWPEHIRSFKVAGTFDDCQRMVKQTLVDPKSTAKLRLTSANSISIARLLPQMVYYAHSSLQFWRETGRPANFIIPVGNLGNSLACIWTRHIGLPIDQVVLATNANPVLSRYFGEGVWEPSETISTLASAMDVGNPSNAERLFDLFPPSEKAESEVTAHQVSDLQIQDSIVDAWEKLQIAICPHTATAWQVRRWLETEQPGKDWIVVATAHPAKFEKIVEPLLGHSVEVPPALAELLDRSASVQELAPHQADLRDALLGEPAHRIRFILTATFVWAVASSVFAIWYFGINTELTSGEFRDFALGNMGKLLLFVGRIACVGVLFSLLAREILRLRKL